MDEVCATCRWWTEGASPLSTASRNPLARPGIGTCRERPPVATIMAGICIGVLPETRGDHDCNAWEPRDDDDGGPDDGENVIPISRAA